MKKLQIITSLFVILFLVSCEKEMMDNQMKSLTKSTGTYFFGSSSNENVASTPTSDAGIVPYIIPGANKGGNRTCEEVGIAFDTTFALCSNKLNYGDFDFDGDFEFDGSFPAGLQVNVENNFISFMADGCITIGDKQYKVGAVIVKGSSAANVYYYPEGILSDEGLAAPNGCHLVSNLTFCFFECEQQEDLIIALKCLYYDGTSYKYAVSAGEKVFNVGWCGEWYLGVNNYPATSSVSLNIPYTSISVGEAIVESGKVTVSLDENLTLVSTYLYIGTLENLLNNNLNSEGCPIYTNTPPWMSNNSSGSSHVFEF